MEPHVGFSLTEGKGDKIIWERSLSVCKEQYQRKLSSLSIILFTYVSKMYYFVLSFQT